MSPTSPRSVVGQRLRRPDAPDKVKGSAMYVEDLPLAGALYGGVLRSPHAHARIRKLDAARARAVPGVRAVITAREIPGRNIIPMVQSDLQPQTSNRKLPRISPPRGVCATSG